VIPPVSKPRPALASLLALVLLAAASTAAPAATAATTTAPAPLTQAHAHNDYEHSRPLLDALDQGFCSVEADIHLVDGALLVAHDREQARPDRTLQALYLDPLRARARANGGRIHAGGPPVTLLIDLKTEAETTWARLRDVLAAYPDLLTRFTPTSTRTNAVTVILSGNRPWDTLAAEPERLAALDGRLPDLDRNPPPSPHLVPLVSHSWRPTFQWNGTGPMPADEKARLEGYVRRAHQQGRRIRFWGAADGPAVWKAHADAGVDYINTDRLAELAAFLRTPSVR
jgi:glycerophosphoryl diester phosphodiesterase